MSERSSAEAALGTALADCGAAFASDARQASACEVELIDEMLQSLEEAGGHVTDGEAGSLADWLEAFSGPGEERRESLADIVSLIVRDLAPEDAPPSEGGAAELWHNDRPLELLAEEAKSAWGGVSTVQGKRVATWQALP